MAERNQIKERNNIRIDIFGYRFQKGLVLLSQPIMRITRTFCRSIEASQKHLEKTTQSNQRCERFLEIFWKILKFGKFLQIQLVQRENRICWKFLEIHFAASATWFVAASLNLSIATSEKGEIYIQSHRRGHSRGSSNIFWATRVVQKI